VSGQVPPGCCQPDAPSTYSAKWDLAEPDSLHSGRNKLQTSYTFEITWQRSLSPQLSKRAARCSRAFLGSGFLQRVPIGRQDPANTNRQDTTGESTAQLFSSDGIVLSGAVLVLSVSGARNRLTAQPSDGEIVIGIAHRLRRSSSEVQIRFDYDHEHRRCATEHEHDSMPERRWSPGSHERLSND